MRDARMSEVLQYLIETSALPLMPVERGEYTHRLLKVTSPGGDDFSADATVIDGAARRKKGTRTYRGQREHDICKVHLMSGNLTNMVTACAIESRSAAESPLFPGLLYATVKATRIANLFGDRAYTDTRTYALSEAVGARGWFRFKETHTGASGGVFRRMFKWAEAHEFREMCFKRNNVESTISSWKRVIAGGIREKTATVLSRNEIAMKNEVYAMMVAHNIRCLSSSSNLVGLDKKFLSPAVDQRAAAD